jgi:hypothetical protein
MKRFTWLLAVSLFLTLVFRAQAVTLPIYGPATFNFTASTQNLFYIQISNKTNHTSTSTNITLVEKSTVSSFVFNSAYVLNLLTNSLNTNLPAGAKLFIKGSSSSFYFYVTDSTGTNIVLDTTAVSPVLQLEAPAQTTAGSYTLITSQTASGNTYSGNDTEVYTSYMLISYDDSAKTTGDGTHSLFELSGMLVNKYSENIATGKFKESVSLSGAGGGMIRNKSAVLKGTLTGQLAGVSGP